MNRGMRCLIRRTGSLNAVIVSRFARRIDELVEMLIEAAVADWAAEDWRRFDDLEPNCVVRIYHYCLRRKRSDATFEWLGVTAEWHQFDPQMLQGEKSANTAKRPDLRFVMGESSRLFEAKRLACRSPFPGNYVDKGIIERFICGRYIVEGDRAGMLGFLIEEPVAQVVPAVNKAIDGRPALSAADHLRHHRTVTVGYDLYHSNHREVDGQDIHLTHHMVQVDWSQMPSS